MHEFILGVNEFELIFAEITRKTVVNSIQSIFGKRLLTIHIHKHCKASHR